MMTVPAVMVNGLPENNGLVHESAFQLTYVASDRELDI